jgi:hypothetical protein
MVDLEEGTTKYAKSAKREATLLFKSESYKIVGGCFEVYKKKGNGFRVFRAFRSLKLFQIAE